MFKYIYYLIYYIETYVQYVGCNDITRAKQMKQMSVLSIPCPLTWIWGFLATVCSKLMPGRLLMLQCAGINQHTFVSRGLSSLAFFYDIRKGYQPQEPKLKPVGVPKVHYWSTITHKQILHGTSLNQFQFGIYCKNKKHYILYYLFCRHIKFTHQQQN